jgi:group I intron endonuclease
MINITSKVNPIIGIYKITSPSNKVYIGQSVNVKKRWINYKGLHSKSSGPHLLRSLIKHGYKSHTFEVIEECSIEQLNERETYWKQCELDKVNDDYSKVLFCDLHDNGAGPRSEQTKIRIGKANKGKKRTEECKQKISNFQKGRPKPKGFGEKLSQALKGRIISEEAKQLISKRLKGVPNLKNRKPKPPGFGKNLPGSPTKAVHRISPIDSNIVETYPSLKLASELTGIDGGAISQCCTGRLKTAGKWKWSFVVS